MQEKLIRGHWFFPYISRQAITKCNEKTSSSPTSWAITKAATSKNPGRSQKDQVRDRVTNIRAWLMVLTCRYTAEASFLKSSASFCWRLETPNVRCVLHNKNQFEQKKKESLTGKNKKFGVHLTKKIKESYRKEVCLVCCPKEDDCHHSQITAENDSSCKDLCQLPAIRLRRRLHPILWYCHNGT